MPRGHWVQGRSWFKPVTLLYRPGAQGSQTVLAALAFLPGLHTSHSAAPAVLIFPSLHALHVLAVEPVRSMNRPAGHVTHTVAPRVDIVFPRWHAVHDVCSETLLKRPTSQSSHSLLRPRLFE